MESIMQNLVICVFHWVDLMVTCSPSLWYLFPLVLIFYLCFCCRFVDLEHYTEWLRALLLWLNVLWVGTKSIPGISYRIKFGVTTCSFLGICKWKHLLTLSRNFCVYIFYSFALHIIHTHCFQPSPCILCLCITFNAIYCCLNFYFEVYFYINIAYCM